MTARGTGRFFLALVVSLAAYEVGFTRSLNLGAAWFGGWGIAAAAVVFGGFLAVLFTAVYDGPPALIRLIRRGDVDRGTYVRLG